MPESDVSVVPANQASWAVGWVAVEPREMNAGCRGTFIVAGFREVSRPTTRRVVMRLDLG